MGYPKVLPSRDFIEETDVLDDRPGYDKLAVDPVEAPADPAIPG